MERDQYQLQRLLSRRSFLGISGLGAAAALGISLESANATQHVKRREVTAASTDSGYHQPFALDASSVLSEDHFLVEVGKIDPTKDKVVAYSRTDGQVEAVLLRNGIVSQVFRDPAAAGGWSTREIAAGATDMVAGVADNKQGWPTLQVFYRTSSGDIKHLIEDLPGSNGISSGTFTPIDDVKWGADLKDPPLQITNDLYRNLLVFCITPASSKNATDSKLGFHWTGWGHPGGQTQSGVLSGFGMYQAQGKLTTGSAVVSYALTAFLNQPALLLYVPTADGVHVYQHEFQSEFQTEHLTVNAKLDDFYVPPPTFAPPLTPEHVTVESIDYLFSPNVNYLPTAIVRGVNQELYALTVDYLNKKWYAQQLQLPKDAKREAGKWDWEPSNLNLGEDNYLKTNTLLNLFLVSGGTLSVVRQVDLNNANKNSVNPVYNPAVPLQGGLAGVSSQTRASASDELVAVDRDGNLEVLTKRSDGGWNANQIHLPATEPAEVSTYRVQLTLSDDWGTRVAAKPLQVTSSGPAIALLNGRSVTLSSTPMTFTTDRSGQVTIPIVADALSAPKLTVSGGGLTAPVVVSPSDAVNAYMSGTVTLNYLPTMSAGTLAAASTLSGATLFPLARQDKDIAGQAAKVFAGAAAAGADPTVNGQVATEAHAEGLNGVGTRGHRVHTTREPVTLGSRVALGVATFKVDGVELSFSDLAHDALYAIKKGAAKVSEVVLTWDKSLNRWVSTITADFDAWAHQVLSVTIQGLDEAAHIFNAVVNKLGAVLTDVIDWLKAHVLKLLADTVTLASRYDGWLLALSDELYTLTQKAKGGADHWLQGQEAEIRAALDKLKAQLGSRSISSFTAPPKGNTVLDTGSQPAPQQPTSANASWLLEKVTQSGPGLAKTPAVDDALSTLVNQAKSSIGSVGQDFIKAANDFRNSLASLVSNPKNFGTVGIDKLIDALGNVVKAALDAAQGMIDLVLNLIAVAISVFKAILSTPLTALPVLGPLLKAAGMSKAPTVGGLVTLLVAFPTVLGYKLAHLDADALPFKNDKSTSVQSVADAADDLSYTTFAAASFWGLMDTIASYYVAGGSEPPALFSWIDMAAPAVISALTVPAHDDGLPFTSAIQLDDKADVYTAVAWGAGAMPGVFAAVSYWGGEGAAEPMLFLTSLTGLLAAVSGVIAALDTSPSPADAAEPAVLAVLANVAPGLAYGLEKSVVASTDGLSAILAGTIGGVCTFVASAMDGFGVE
ncbi:MAG TPA: hypothetical protein VMF57_01350 [Solirubrobacteraceae bacterium]|nr:hypothetical protein [Solirubrobacteraceae bacterium]